MEHRWGRRVRTNVSVRVLAAPASAGYGRLRDISISGGYIETRLQLPPLSSLRMTVDSQTRPANAARVVHAVVVRCEADGIGVEWLDGGSETVTALIKDTRVPRAQILRYATGTNIPRRPREHSSSSSS